MLDELPTQAQVSATRSDVGTTGIPTTLPESCVAGPLGQGDTALPALSNVGLPNPPTGLEISTRLRGRKKPVRRTEAQREAARQNIQRFHKMVQDGLVEHPSRSKVPGLRALLRKGKIKNQTIQRAVNDYVRSTIEELGGEDALSTGQLAIITIQRIILASILLIEHEMARFGTIATPDGDLRPYIKLLQGHATTFRANQQALGLAKPRTRERKPPRLQELMAGATEVLSGS
jgi:hypothetical protein